MKLALVTGGAHRVGAVISGAFAEAGYAVAIHSHRSDEPEAGLREILDRTKARWAIFRGDFQIEADVLRLVDDVADAFGRPPDCLVNNASIFGGSDWTTAGLGEFTENYQVNTIAPILIARQLAARVGPDGRATVINLVDQAVRHPTVDHAAYTLSKMALEQATLAMAQAMAPALRINAVAPGLNLPTDDYAPDQIDRLAAMMPLRQLPAPADIAEAVLYLANARSVVGQTLFVDAGASMINFGRDFIHLGLGTDDAPR